MRTRRVLWLAITLLIAAYVLISTVGGIFLAENTLHPKRRVLSTKEKLQAPAWAEDDDATLREVSITTQYDRIILRAWSVRPEKSNGDSVILLHGLKDNRVAMEDYADFLLLQGYTVLMPDARAHGESEGNIATYGLLEADDIHQWVDWLETNEHPHCIFGFGESMGAGQILGALKTEARFCAVAAECPFSSFREMAYERLARPFHAGPWLGRTLLRPIVDIAFVYARLRYGVNFDKVSPSEAVAKSHAPVLLIHGQTDRTISVRHSRLIAARSPRVVLWELPNTGHSNAIDTDPNDLQKRLLGWFHSHSSAISVAAVQIQKN